MSTLSMWHPCHIEELCDLQIFGFNIFFIFQWFILKYNLPQTFFVSEYDEMHLLPEPLFSIPTDNTYIMNIVGTDLGRIFMAGKDGCLYELAYQV